MIIFEKVRWKNFLSTGNNFSEIDLLKNKTNLIIGANGAGKSTILDALTFALFGRGFRKISKSALINSINEKDCVVELGFSIGKNKYTVIRGIKPNKFIIYLNGEPLDQDHTVAIQQKNLEQNILRMSYKSFTQVVVLGSSTFVPFMRLPQVQRREIIEDILDIQIFSVMNDLLKDKVRENRDELYKLEGELNVQKQQIDLQKSYMLDLEKKTQAEVERKQNKIVELEGDETVSMKAIEEHNKDAARLQLQLTELSDVSKKLKKLYSFRTKVDQKLKSHKRDHKFFHDTENCPKCGQGIGEEHKLQMISSTEERISELDKGYAELEQSIKEEEDREQQFTHLSGRVIEINSAINQLNFQISSTRDIIKDIEFEIDELNKDTTDKKAEFEKLKTLIETSNDTKTSLAATKKDKDTLFVASKLLKDSGIKTRIIKTYLPTMNKLINKYLQGMEFYVNFTLDENFEETIKSRYRDIFTYESFSEGEKARIDIALLLTWRSIAKLKNSVDTNLLILDEIFDGSLDQSGSSDLGWILRNFDDSTNVFVISHKESMSDKFDRTLIVEKPKNYSTISEY